MPTPAFTVLRPSWLPEPMTVREQVNGDIVLLGFDPQPDDGGGALLTLREVPLRIISEGGSADPQATQERIGDHDVTVVHRGQSCITYTWDAGDLPLTLSNPYVSTGEARYACEEMWLIVESVR